MRNLHVLVLLALGVASVFSVVYIHSTFKTGPAEAQKRGPRRRDAVNPSGTTFDYIVVGSGPGGGVPASHLASKGFRVLLLEAGGADPVRICIYFVQLLRKVSPI